MKNKAVDYLSRLVSPAGKSINMLTASINDRPAFHTRSHTQSVSDPTSTHPVIPQLHISQDDTPMLKSLTADQWDALLQMQRTDPFCKCISKRLLNGKAPHHEVNTFTHVKGLLYKHVSDAGKQFLALVIPKSWKLLPTQLLTTLQLELSNIKDMYKSSETTITSAINFLNSNQLQTSTQCKRSLLPFLGAALSWLTGSTTTKDIHSIKTRINQLIATQTFQCSTLVHIVLILNVTGYATQVNRHSINNLIDAICTTSKDINNLYNLTTSLAASIYFNQMVLHIISVFANL